MKNSDKYKQIKKIAQDHPAQKTLRIYDEAQKVIDRYNVATGKNTEIQYTSANTSHPRRIDNYANNTTTKIR